MKVIPLKEPLIPHFLHYCRLYGREHDESYLPQRNFFSLSLDHPTYLLVDQPGRVKGAASLILTPAYRRIHKGRMGIFHVLGHDPTGYQQLLAAFQAHCRRIYHLYLFLPEDQTLSQQGVEACQFKRERYSYLLVAHNGQIRPPNFPPDYALRPLCWDKEEEIWCHLMNDNFGQLAGHTPCTVDHVRDYLQQPTYLEGGMMILWQGEKAIGTIHVMKSQEASLNAAEIHGISVLASARKKGLGRNLLRAGAQYALQRGLSMSYLNVNAENTHAFTLYLQEGFEKYLCMICYGRDLRQHPLLPFTPKRERNKIASPTEAHPSR